MLTEHLKILFLEDNPDDVELAEDVLRQHSITFTARRVDTREAFARAIEDFQPDIILVDVKLPHYDGRRALEFVREQHPEIPVVVMTGVLGDEEAISLLTEGARDYVLKGNLARLPVAVRHALSVEQGIRARKAAELALAESEAKFRTLFESSPDAVWIMEGHRFVECNPAAVSLFGLKSRADFLNVHPSAISPEFQPDGEASFDKAERMMTLADQQGINRFEWLHRRADGSDFAAEVTLSGITLRGRQAIHAVVRDISDRKQAEEKLKQSEARFREMAEISPLAIYVSSDVEQVADYINPTFTRLFGYTLADVPTVAHWWPLAYPDAGYRRQVSEEWQRKVERAIEEKASIEPMEVVVTCKDGSTKTVSWGYVSTEAQNWAFGLDLTDLKRNETALRVKARLAQALLELPRASESLDEAAFMQRGQELAEDLTGSRIAFIHFVNDDEESIELVTWSRRTLEHYCTAAYDRHYPVSQAGIWADALRRRHAVVFNDYAASPNKRGLPEGHAELKRLISVPVIENGRVVMLTGVGNKAADYTDQDVESVQLIANEIWRLVQGKRVLSTLRESEARLRKAQTMGLIGSWEYDLASGQIWGSEEGFNIYGIAPTPGGLIPLEQIEACIPDKERVHQALVDLIESGKPYHLEFAIHPRDGHPQRIIVSMAELIRNERGEPVKVTGVIQDITERKRAEADLERRNTDLERINRAAVDREWRMIELKQRINALSSQLGQPAPYPLDFLTRDTDGPDPPIEGNPA